MTLSAEATDSQRVRVTLGVALVGLALMLAAALMVYFNRPPEQPFTGAVRGVPSAQRLEDARTLNATLLVAGLLFMLFLVTGYAFVRASRSYRKHLTAKPSAATANRSVWEMHKPPPEPSAPALPQDQRPPNVDPPLPPSSEPPS